MMIREIKSYTLVILMDYYSVRKRLHTVKCHETNVKENKKYKNLYIQFNQNCINLPIKMERVLGV